MFIVLAALSTLPQSATYDEATNLGIGERLLRTRDWSARYSWHHPPLSFYLAALPSAAPDALVGGMDPLTRARFAMLIASIALAWLVFRWARDLYGPTAGLVALVLAAFSPNLLAHAALVTSDATLTSTVLASAYALWRYGRRPSPGRAAVAGLAIGLSVLSKFTALLFVPLWAIVVLVGGWPKRRGRAVADLVAIGAIALALLHAGYLFTGSTRTLAPRSALMQRWADPALTLLFPEPFLRGIDFQLAHADQGEWGFLMGELSRKGWPQYFLVAFLIKTPIALQAVLVAALLMVRKPRACPEDARDTERPPTAWITALTLVAPPIWLFVYMSLFNRIDIGFRYVLPMLPFLHVAISRLAAIEYRRPRRVQALLGGALVLYVAESLSVFPWYLCFFNAWVGGPAQGYKYLIDSNLDWGQGARAALRYVQAHYPDVLFRPGAHFVHGRIVVNANALQGLSPEERETYAWLRPFKPVGRIGYSYLIYDVPLSAVPRNLCGAEGHAYLDCVYTSFRRFARGDAEFRHAVDCVGRDTDNLLALARIYEAKGRPDRVRQVLERMPNDPHARAMLKAIAARASVRDDAQNRPRAKLKKPEAGP